MRQENLRVFSLSFFLELGYLMVRELFAHEKESRDG